MLGLKSAVQLKRGIHPTQSKQESTQMNATLQDKYATNVVDGTAVLIIVHNPRPRKRILIICYICCAAWFVRWKPCINLLPNVYSAKFDK